MPRLFPVIGRSWDFLQKQSALHSVALWLLFLPSFAIHSLTRLLPVADVASTPAQENAALGIALVILLLYVVVAWGMACTLVVGKRLLQHNAGRTRTSFKAVRKQALGFVLPLIITSIIQLGMTILWSVLLIIPGVIYATRTWFFPVILVSEGIGYRPGLRRSAEMVRGKTLSVFLLATALWLLLMLPSLVLIIVMGEVFPITPNVAGVFADAAVSVVETIGLLLYILAMIVVYGELRATNSRAKESHERQESVE